MPKEISLPGWRLLRVLVDLLCGVGAMLAAFWFRIAVPLPFTIGLLPADRISFFADAIPLVLLLQNATLYFFGFYEVPHPKGNEDRLRRLSVAVGLQGLLMVSFLFFQSQRFPRTVVLIFVVFNILFLLLTRQLLDRLLRTPKRKALVVGCGAGARRLAKDISRYPWYGLEIVGHVPAPGEQVGDDEPVLGSYEDLEDLVDALAVDEVVIADDTPSWQTDLVEGLSSRGRSRIGVLLFPNPFESLLGRSRFRSVHDIPLIELGLHQRWTGHEAIKRAFDCLLAVSLLVLFSPLLLLSCLLIRATSRGPIFYRQERVGLDQRPFVLWKLRTMRTDAERAGEQLATRDDPRKTAVGTWLRATRIDELPQLFNVLKGEMSLVGPRPERPGFVARYLEEVPGYGARFSIRPGVTGLAQVNGEYESTAENKLRYDLAYASNASLWLDLTILLRTVRTVLTSRGI